MIVDTKRDSTFTFDRDERLKSRKLIEQLFRRKLFVQDPILRIYYSETELETKFPAQFAFTASKKQFPKAVDRNRIKRLLRESVRHAKSGFYSILKEKNKKLTLLLSFQGKELPALEQVNKSAASLLSAIIKTLN